MGCQKEVAQMKNHELDAVDRTILNILQRNAKCPLKEIAEKVYLSTPAVSARIEKMEKEGYILGYQAQVNPEALGYQGTDQSGGFAGGKKCVLSVCEKVFKCDRMQLCDRRIFYGVGSTVSQHNRAG